MLNQLKLEIASRKIKNEEITIQNEFVNLDNFNLILMYSLCLRNEKFNLLVRIKFLNLFLYTNVPVYLNKN
jgi:hypothetical protein